VPDTQLPRALRPPGAPALRARTAALEARVVDRHPSRRRRASSGCRRCSSPCSSRRTAPPPNGRRGGLWCRVSARRRTSCEIPGEARSSKTVTLSAFEAGNRSPVSKITRPLPSSTSTRYLLAFAIPLEQGVPARLWRALRRFAGLGGNSSKAYSPLHSVHLDPAVWRSAANGRVRVSTASEPAVAT
jgi:hypothetical protein